MDTQLGVRRTFVAALIGILVFEAGAAAPAFATSQASAPAPEPAPALSVPAEPVDSETPPAPAAPSERADLRSASTRTFENADGTFISELFSYPIHYQPPDDSDEEWVPIELGFSASQKPGAVAESTKAPVAISVGANKQAAGFLTLDTNGQRIAFSLPAPASARATDVTPTFSDNVAEWEDFLPGIDLRVIAGATGAKSFLVFDEHPAETAWTFLIDAPGLSAELADDGSVLLVGANKKSVARIPAPYAVDASASAERGGGEMTDQVSLSVARDGSRIALTVSVDADWLAKAVYPVFVDPTVTTLTTGSSSYGDAFVSSQYPTMNFADYVRPDSPYYHEHWLGMSPTNLSQVNKVLMKFDVSAMSNATIDLAKLDVYPYHQYYNAPTATTTWLNRITTTWTESGVTWNTDAGSSALTSASLVEGSKGYFTITGLVQDWVDGTYTNYGVKLHENGNNGTYWKRLISAEQGGSNVPHLVVTWHRPVGTPSDPTAGEWTKNRTLSWTYSDEDGAAQSHYQVQVDNNSDFSSILSQSGTVSSSTKSWNIPTSVSLTNGTTYYWRVKVKNGTGWSNWSSGASFKWDAAMTSFTSSAIDGAITAADPNYYELGNGTVTIKLRGSDGNSGIKLTYLRLYNATDEMRVVHDWAVGGTHCNEYNTSTLVDATACSESYNSGGTREVTFTVAGLNQSTSFDVQYYFTDYAGNTVGYTDTGKNLIFDATAPTGSISSPAANATVSGTVTISGTASDANFHQYELHYGAGSAPTSWTSIGTNPRTTPVTNGTLGSWNTSALATGTYTIRLIVKDKARVSSGFTTVTRTVTVNNDLPAAVISDPTGDRLVDGIIEISGTASASANFADYTIHYGVGCAPTSWIDIGVNPRTSQVSDGLLGVWDTAGLSGQHTIRLVARRSDGPTATDTVCVRIGSSLGRQSQHTFESWDLGGGDELAVNVATGNAALTHPLVSLPIRGGAFPLTLTYNSLSAENVGPGVGWQLNLQRRLAVNPNGTVTFVDADGALHLFTNPQTSGSVTTYTRPASLYAGLTKDVNQPVEFTLTYRDGSVDRFDLAAATGRLERSVDRHGNAIVLTYGTANQIAQVTDPAGRTIDFAWDGSGRLTSISDWAYLDGSGAVQAMATGSRRTYRFFHAAGGLLAGWSEPLNTSGSCPTGGSYLTCLTYTDGLLTGVSKTQTVTTFSAGTLGTATRAIATAIGYADGRVARVTDAEQQTQAVPASTTFNWDEPDSVTVARPTTTTGYELVAADDPYARVRSVLRYLDPATPIERRTSWDVSFPIEPASVTDSYGAVLGTPARTVSYLYQPGSLGLVSRIVEPLTAATNRWIEQTYNVNNDVTQTIVSQDGSASLRTVTRYCYDPGCTLTGSGPILLAQIEIYLSGGPATNDTNVRTDFAYDAYGQRTSITRHNRDASGAVLDDREDRLVYDADGNLMAEIVNYADGAVSGGGDLTPNATTQARTDLTTANSYDTAGNRISTADPRRAILAASGSPGADDYVTRWTFDALNRPLTERTPTTPGISSAQKTSTSTHDELGAVRAATDFGGFVTASEFDRAGRALRSFEDPPDTTNPAVVHPAVAASINALDADGRVVASKDRRQVGDAALGQTEIAYDGLGRVTFVTSAAGTADESLTETAYDALDRRTSYVVGGQATAYAHDLGGRVTATDDGFTCTTESFDYRDLATSTVHGKDGNGCAGTGQYIVTHVYDGLGRLIRDEQGSLRPLDDVFDAAGNRLRSAPVTEAAGGGTTTVVTTFTVNRLDQLAAEQRDDGTSTRISKTTYDAAGNPVDRCRWEGGSAGDCPTGTNPPTQLSTTTYDARNQRLSLTDGATNQTTVYDPDHNYHAEVVYTPISAGVELQTLYGYDERHRLISLVTQQCTISTGHACASTLPLGSSAYAYDANDNRVQVTESADAATPVNLFYCYDARDQVVARNTGAGCDISTDEEYTYDASGNRLSATDTSGTRTFSYTADGQYTGATHDESGRFSAWNGWSFAGYDAAGRLTEACEDPCGSSDPRMTFTYDADGRRTGITETTGATTTTTELRYVDGRISAEYVNGVLARSYVTDESGAIVKMIVGSGSNAKTYLVTWNGHGDALNLLHLSGGTVALANSFTYDTWGAATVQTHNGYADLGFRFRYVGQHGVQDDTLIGLPLLLMGARHYAPALGRFVQPDPVALEENQYAYAGNNPVSYADPTGTCWWCNLASQAWNWLGTRGWPVVQSFLGSAWNWINRTGAVPWIQRNWTLLQQGASRTLQVSGAVSKISSDKWNYIMTRPTHAWLANGVSQQRASEVIRSTLLRNGMQMTPGRAFAVQSGWHWINWGFKSICVTGFVTYANVVIVSNAWIITRGC